MNAYEDAVFDVVKRELEKSMDDPKGLGSLGFNKDRYGHPQATGWEGRNYYNISPQEPMPHVQAVVHYSEPENKVTVSIRIGYFKPVSHPAKESFDARQQMRTSPNGFTSR
jgi:hypothetical protein